MLNCMNCNKPVPENDAKVFASVFVCPACCGSAEHLYERLQSELKNLLVMAKEGIRIALIEGRLHFGEQELKEASKTDVLRTIIQLEEARQRNKKEKE